MAKVTSWSGSSQLLGSGKRNKRLIKPEDLPRVVYAHTQTVVNKRLQVALDSIEEKVREESDKLFSIMAKNSVNVSNDPYAGTPYTNRVWERLSAIYRKKKGHERFWFNTGKLRDYLETSIPSNVFGKPQVRAILNERARGWQRANIYVDPYPNTAHPNFPDDIRNRFFGTRKDGLFNEEDRPILSPAMRALIDMRINRIVKEAIKEAMIR